MINPPWKITFAVKKRLTTDLKRMTKMVIIKLFIEPTEWVNSQVIMENPPCICLGHCHLNRAITWKHFQLPNAEEIFAEKYGSKYFFFKADASNCFSKIPLYKNCSKLFTFHTKFGDYRFTRLPYCIHSTSKIYKIKMSVIKGIKGARNVQIDIIVWSSDLE